MLGPVIAITRKDLKIFFKDPGAVVLIFLMPFMFIVLMSYALAEPFGSVQDRAIRLPVVDENGGPLAAKVIERLGAMDSFEIQTAADGTPLTRDRLEHMIAEGAEEFGLVFEAGGERTMPRVLLVADPGATSQLVEPVLGTVRGLVREQSLAGRVPAVVDRLIDANVPGVLPQKEGIKAQARQEVAGLLEDDSGPRVIRAAPAGMRARAVPDPFQQNVPGYTIFGIFWIVVLLGESVLLERRDGTFRRLLVAPVGRATMLLGKLVPYYLINLLQIVIMLGAARLLFGMELGSSPLGLVLVSLAASAAATGLGVLVAALARTEAQTRGLSILVLLTLAALGGCFVPRFIMPDALQAIGLVTPHAWALDAYQDLLVRGLGPGDILPEVGALAAFAAVFFTIGAWRFRFE